MLRNGKRSGIIIIMNNTHYNILCLVKPIVIIELTSFLEQLSVCPKKLNFEVLFEGEGLHCGPCIQWR